MRYVALSLLILMAGSVRVNPQAGPFDKSRGQPSVLNQLGIVTPPKDIDFKIIIIVPPKDLDRGMVRNSCSKENQIDCVPQLVLHGTEANPLLRTPPARIKHRR